MALFAIQPIFFWHVVLILMSTLIGHFLARTTYVDTIKYIQKRYREIQDFVSFIRRCIMYTKKSMIYDNFTTQNNNHQCTLTKTHLDMIASRRWKELLVWIVFHPDELLFVDKRNQTVLHHACLFRAPAQIISMLLYQQPKLAQIQNVDDEIPLHWAIRLSAPNEVIRLLLSVHPSSACCIKDKDGNTALSMIWERYESPLLEGWWRSGRYDVIRNSGWVSILFFFQCYSYYLESLQQLISTTELNELDLLEKIEEHGNSFRPLHTSTRCPTCPLILYTLLLRVYKDQIHEHDNVGRLPLAVACLSPISNRSVGAFTKVHLLLAEDPSTSEAMDNNGRIPLFTALESRLSWDEGVERLITLYPKSLLLCDTLTRLPAFLLAASSDPNLTSQPHEKLCDEGVATFSKDHKMHFDQAHLSTIFSILRKDPAQINVTVRLL